MSHSHSPPIQVPGSGLAQMGFKHAEWLHRRHSRWTIGFLENEWEEFISSSTMQTPCNSLPMVSRQIPTAPGNLTASLPNQGKLTQRCVASAQSTRLLAGGSAGIQAKLLAHYKHATLRDVGYRASEAAMSVPIADEITGAIPSFIYNFMEFIPADKLDEKQLETSFSMQFRRWPRVWHSLDYP